MEKVSDKDICIFYRQSRTFGNVTSAEIKFRFVGSVGEHFLLIFHVASDGRSGNGRNRSETCSKGARISRELNNMTHQDA
jgi:hypothetical protein